MEPIPVSDPRRAALAEHEQLSAAFERVLAGGRYVHGPEHEAFEEELAAFLGAAHCVGVASGTDALRLGFQAVGCAEGDAIVTAANCGGYATTAARALGLEVRFADVDPVTLGLTAASVEAALAPGVRAVVATHLYGIVGEIDELAGLCRERGVALVEDCAQAAGAIRGGRRAGTFGDVAAFSFYPTKNLAALGDGGALVTGGADTAARARSLRQYGWAAKYEVALDGGANSRLDELQAAVLRTRLPLLDAANARRREIVASYEAALPASAGRFVARPGEDYVAHLAVLVVEDREMARAAFTAAGIGTDVHYPIPDHRQPAWAADFANARLPVTEAAAGRVLTLPCFPELTGVEVERVCEVLRGL